jgi:hypothetical protein
VGNLWNAMRLGKVGIRPEIPRNKQEGFDMSTIHCFLDKLPHFIGRSRQTAHVQLPVRPENLIRP